MSTTDPYRYPGTTVLRNRLGIRDTAQLEQAERLLVTQRTAEGIPAGTFGLDQMKAIHRHLFQDLYEWAGEIRTVEIAKGGQQFQFRQFIKTGMADVRARENRIRKSTLPPILDHITSTARASTPGIAAKSQVRENGIRRSALSPVFLSAYGSGRRLFIVRSLDTPLALRQLQGLQILLSH